MSPEATAPIAPTAPTTPIPHGTDPCATTTLPAASVPEPTTAHRLRRRLHGWLRRVAYPMLLANGALLCAYAITAGLDLETILAPIFIGFIVAMLGLERVIPFRRDWQPRAGEVARDGIYLTQGLIFGGLGQLIAGTAAVLFTAGNNGLPLWLAAPLAIVLADLCFYGFHRMTHINRWLWREHGVHHVVDKVNTLNANTTHFLDILLGNIVVYAPLMALGFGAEAIFIVTVARAMMTFGSHANIDVRLGWLGHVIMGPEHHRLHHSADLREAGNYGTILTLWDRVFGTFTWVPGRHIARAGVVDPDSFPAPHRILASAVHPFRRERPAA